MGRKGNAVLMNESVWMCLREIRIINLRIMYMGICIEGVLDCDSCLCTRNGEIRGGKRWLLGGIERVYRSM